MGLPTKGLLAEIPKQAREDISALGREMGNPSEAFLCFMTFYVLKTATKYVSQLHLLCHISH